MTIEELYDWAYDNGYQDYEITISHGNTSISFLDEDLIVDENSRVIIIEN